MQLIVTDTQIRTFIGDIVEGMIGKNKKRKHQLFKRLQVVENEIVFFFFWFPSEGWSPISCAGSDWESRGTHREPASVWRCQMTGLAHETDCRRVAR